MTANVVVAQADFERVRQDNQAIEVRLSSRPEQILKARYLRETPLLTDRLPSRFLGSSAGGDIPVDVRDERGLKTINRVYQLEVALPDEAGGAHFGQRLHVLFVHSDQALGMRLLRQLQRIWLTMSG